VKAWSYTIGGTAQFSTAPAVADGMIYIGTVDHNIGSETGMLDALDAKTGTQLWSKPIGDVISTTPIVADGVVYIGSMNEINDTSSLYALNAKTGIKLWNYATGQSFSSTAPTVAKGIVYIGAENNTLVALDARTGTRLWSYSAGATSRFSNEPTVANGVVYVTSEVYTPGSLPNGMLEALDARTGTRLWSYSAGATSNFTALKVSGGMVYITSNDYTNDSETDTLYALNATSGTKVWSYDIGSGVDSALSVANGVVYIDSLSYGKLSALDAKFGTRLWISFTRGSLEFPPTVTNTIVYASSLKTIYAFSLSTVAASPTATSSSLVATPTPRLAPTINRAPVSADIPGLHIQSMEGLQCPLSHSFLPLPANDLVFTTARLTYSKNEIQQIRNYLHEIIYGSESITSAYTLTPPPTLHWISGSANCTLNLEISNTGNTAVQINSLGVQLASAPQANNTQQLHTLDVCSVANQQDAWSFGCGEGPSGGGGCGAYSVNIVLKTAPASTIFAAAPIGEVGGCPLPILHPNDTIEIGIQFSSPGMKPHTVAPYLYTVVPVLTIADSNGSHTFTLSSMAGIAAFVDEQQITCYGLLHEQDSTFVPVRATPGSTICLA
jgi:outer membrane protein assembly factor BamB